MVKPTADPALYRPAVGVAIFNLDGKVWVGHRKGEKGAHVWQMPQGGVDPGESYEFAAMREMEEETGIRLTHVQPLGFIDKELFYDFPEDHVGKRGEKWRGQRQIWFAVRFTGRKQDINIKFQSPPEFSKWKWVKLSKTPELIVPFKHKVYKKVAKEFTDYAHPVK